MEYTCSEKKSQCGQSLQNADLLTPCLTEQRVFDRVLKGEEEDVPWASHPTGLEAQVQDLVPSPHSLVSVPDGRPGQWYPPLPVVRYPPQLGTS